MQAETKLERFLESRYFLAVVLILVAVSSFSLGRISKIHDAREPVRLISSAGVGEVKGVATSNISLDSASVVASKNGTKYHLATCPGAKQISEKNKISFASIEEARASGYTPAANCKGLK